jgi:hypothetical protein
MTFSKTYITAITSLLTILAATFGTDLPDQLNETSIEQALLTLAGLVSFIVTIVERYRKGGVTILGRKV